jgi:hypothetical protein
MLREVEALLVVYPELVPGRICRFLSGWPLSFFIRILPISNFPEKHNRFLSENSWPIRGRCCAVCSQVVEKAVFSRLVKNIRMHGARNQEE